MNILIIRNYPSYMSVKNNTYNIQEVGLAKALVRRGHKCDIVFWTDKADEEVEITVSKTANKTITIYYKRGKTTLKNTVFTGCTKLFDKYDILQPCEYNQAQAWLLARNYPNKTVIYHGPYYSDFNRRYNLMCKFFDLFFLGSYKKRNTQFIVKSNLAKDFLESKGLKNIDVTGVGIDAEMLSDGTSDCDQPLYLKLVNDSSQYKILYIGRFEERRNIPFLFEVFKEVRKQLPNTSLYMIGTGNEKYVEQSWQHAKRLGVYENIVWQEKIEQKHLAKIYQLCDCFLLPTEYEIFGMVLLEAMYYKTLVITNKNGGSSVLIKNQENGLIIEAMESNQWASVIVDYLMKTDKRNEIAARASRTISDSFTWDKLSPLFERCYLKKLQSGAD